MKLIVKAIRQATPDSVVITFEKPTEVFDYQSGQYITVILDVNGESVRRSYSLCSSPTEDEFPAIGVKRVNGGKVSNYINDNIKVGSELEILAPMGNFKHAIVPNGQRSVVLIGGGSGLTPLVSIAKTTLAQETASVVSLINVNINREYSLFADEIDALVAKYNGRFRVLNHYNEDEVLTKKGLFRKEMAPKGLPSKDDLKKYLEELSIESSDDNFCYLCGPQGLMDSSELALRAIGIDKHKIMRESFVADTSKVNAEAKSFEGVSEVTIKIMGEEHVIHVQGKSILEAGLEKGIEMPFSCQAGLCTACMGKCTEGKVEMAYSDGLTKEQMEQGYVLTCVGHAKSDKITIEFD
jgi:ring-1,2-phenylacetyl-CoA epoxidase subunit PaaE